MMEYSQAQEDYRDKTKVMIQRQLQITTGKRVNEDDVDEMIEKGNIKVFTQDVRSLYIAVCYGCISHFDLHCLINCFCSARNKDQKLFSFLF